MVFIIFQLSVGGCLWVAEKLFVLPNKEMGYLWDRGNPQPYSYFLIKVTVLGNWNTVSESNVNSNAAESKIKSVPSIVNSLLADSV